MTVYINTTPHALNFVNPDTSEEFVVEKSRWLLNAAIEEKIVKKIENGIQFVETVFRSSPEGWRMIEEIRAEHGDCIIIGSLIAAQAYGGAVVAMVAAPGFERVPPDQKKMNAKKFTIFPPVERESENHPCS